MAFNVGTAAAPSFADLNLDGDLDAVVGAGRRHDPVPREHRHERQAPVYVERTGTANPFRRHQCRRGGRAELR
jgi:hypothetical protein